MEKIGIKMQDDHTQSHFLQIIPYFLFLGLTFLLPIFFIPSSSIAFPYSKMILLFSIVLLSLFSWTIVSFKTGKLVLPFNWFSLSAIFIPIIFLISSLVSANKAASLIGGGYELGTFSFTLLMVLMMFLISIFVRSKEKIFYCYLWFGGAFLVVAIYQILHLVLGPNFLSFNYFTDVTSNPIGKWNDLAVFSGVAVLLSLISLELLVLNKIFKVLFYIVLVLGLFLLAVTNFTIWWNTPITIVTLIGLFALIFFVYFISSSHAAEGENSNTFSSAREQYAADRTMKSELRKIPIPSLIALVFAVIFTLAAGPLTGYLNNAFHINSLDVEPTWQSTIEVSKFSLSHNALLGAGPNRFLSQWFLAKPDGVNPTDFWNTDFNYGVGLIPTFLITTGILGILSWLIFLAFFIYFGWKVLFAKIKDRFSLYLIISSYFSALYLWIMHIVYVPSIVTLSFAFIFTGLFLASLFREGILKEKSISYIHDSRKGFGVIMFLVLLLIGVVVWGYFISNKVVAAAYGNKSAIALNAGDITGAETYIVKSINSDKNPVYYRFLSQVELARMNSLLGRQNLSQDIVKNQFQGLLDNAVSASVFATNLDPTDYQNWISQGLVYETVVPLGVQDASSKAENAYLEALKRNPKQPLIYLLLARLEAKSKNYDKAKEYITSALKQKNNYIDAIYLLAQIQMAEGDSKGALQSLGVAATVAPQNADPYFQLGLLNYQLGNYNDAIGAFTQAINLVPNYADAKYYLGLSFYKAGRVDEAIATFSALVSANPSNSTLSSILNNLKSGRDPLAGLGGSTPTPTPTSATSTKKSNGR